MTFPNALEGIKKIYKAEILELIAAIVGLVAAVLMVVGLASGSDEGIGAGVLGGGALLIVMAVLSVIALIMSIIGAKRAMPDEANFKNAFYCMIVGIIASIVIGFAKSDSVLSNSGETISSITSFLTQYYIVSALIVLAERLGDAAMQNKGANVRKILIVMWIIRIILQIISIFVERSETLGVIAGIIALIAAIVGIIAYIMYLSLLSKARTMLQK